MSCSKALKSNKSRIFKVHNSLLGIFYFLLIIVLPMSIMSFSSSFVAVLFSAYLAYQLLIQKNFCVICVFTYLINILIFLFHF